MLRATGHLDVKMLIGGVLLKTKRKLKRIPIIVYGYYSKRILIYYLINVCACAVYQYHVLPQKYISVKKK